MAFQSEFWTTLWEMKLEEKSQILAVADKKFEGEVKFGKKVTMRVYDTSADIIDYLTETLTFEDLTPSTVELEITEAKAFAFSVSEIDKVQSDPDMASKFLINQINKMEKLIDAFIISKKSLIVSNIVDQSLVELDENNVVSVFAKLRTILNEANVSKVGRFVLVDHTTAEKISLAQELKIVSSNGNKEIAGTEVSNICGFDILTSSSVLPVAGVLSLVAGVKDDTFKYAGQISQIETVKIPGKFSENIQGLYVFGANIFNEAKGAILKVKAYA